MPEPLPAASPCPDLADLLLASEGELPRRRQTEVTAHLRHCAACREQLGNVGLAIREYQDALPGFQTTPAAAEPETRAERLDDFRFRLKQEQRAQSTRDSRLPFRQWLPVAAAVPVLVAAMFFSNRYTSVVRAEELLTRAVAQEQSIELGTVRRLQIEMKRTGARFTRDVGTTVPGVMSVSENAAAADLNHRLESSRFDWRDPLSVRGFRAWHDALSAKTDSVTPVGTGELALRTETTEGLLRSAELIVRRVDFRPLRAKLDFAGFGEVEIVELSRWVSRAPLVAEGPAPTVPAPVGPAAVASVDTLDEAELDVRTTLHEVGVDWNPSIAVSRSSRAVEVRGVVDARHKAAITQALGKLAPVRVALRIEHGPHSHEQETRPSPSTAQPESGATPEKVSASAAVRPLRVGDVAGNASSVDESDIPRLHPDAQPVPLRRWLDRTFGGDERAVIFLLALSTDAEEVQRRAVTFAALAARYPEPETRNLSAAARRKLEVLADAQYRDLAKTVEALDDRLALFLGSSTRRATPISMPREWQACASAIAARTERLEQAIRGVLRERDLPLPTEVSPARPEPPPLSNLRQAVNALWEQLRPA